MLKNIFKNLRNNKNGTMLVTVMMVTAILLAIVIGQTGLVIMRHKLNKIKVASAQALHVAEAGVNYYRWVLYHDHDEYLSRPGCAPGLTCGPFGPYEYKDSEDGTVSGYYELYLTPPAVNGSTIVTVKAIGWLASMPSAKRSIEVRCGISSWSTYSTLADDFMRFGSGTEVWGPIHSNKGIRFDGVAHNLISSAVLNWDDPDHNVLLESTPFDDPNEFGVHNHSQLPVDPIPDGNNPPQNVPAKSNIFLAGRAFPVNTVSFDLLNNYIGEVYALATSAGIVFDPLPAASADPYSVPEYRGCGVAGSTCDEGFHITLKNNNTFDIRGVTSERIDLLCPLFKSNSINNQEATIRNYPIPSNGIIFVKKRAWIDGAINNSRVTVIAFEDPFIGGLADINITDDIAYTPPRDNSGNDTIGLIAQRNVNIGQFSDDNLEINAALIARNGKIQREWYPLICQYDSRDTITVFGSLATKERYGFAFTDGTGYNTRNLIYDNNLTFAPPPHFPTTGEYTFISWDEE